jgi:hypothetical protein
MNEDQVKQTEEQVEETTAEVEVKDSQSVEVHVTGFTLFGQLQ